VTIFVQQKGVMKLLSVRWPVRAGNCLLCVDVQWRLQCCDGVVGGGRR